jgi:predicted DNA-binding transcriptional regulator YafY
MKAMTLQQLADSAGVSVRTLRRWCKPHKKELQACGMSPGIKVIPPKAVKYLADLFCLDIP